jgi:hypothetical protein
MTPPIESVGEDPKTGRPFLFLEGRTPAAWELPSGLGLFTLLLAIDADRYADEELDELASRLRHAGLGYLCAWGPGCARVHRVFDLAFISEELAGIQRPFLMTTDHEGEPLAEALWFAVDLGFQEEMRDPADSPVLIGSDRDDWHAEICHWLSDLEELRRYVTEDLES